MHRDPGDLTDEERGPSPRAWGISLGLWFVTFVTLGLLVVPLLFGRCEAG